MKILANWNFTEDLNLNLRVFFFFRSYCHACWKIDSHGDFEIKILTKRFNSRHPKHLKRSDPLLIEKFVNILAY